MSEVTLTVPEAASTAPADSATAIAAGAAQANAAHAQTAAEEAQATAEAAASTAEAALRMQVPSLSAEEVRAIAREAANEALAETLSVAHEEAEDVEEVSVPQSPLPAPATAEAPSVARRAHPAMRAFLGHLS